MNYHDKFFKTKVEHVFQNQDSELMLLLKEITLNMSHLRRSSTSSVKSVTEKKEETAFPNRQKISFRWQGKRSKIKDKQKVQNKKSQKNEKEKKE